MKTMATSISAAAVIAAATLTACRPPADCTSAPAPAHVQAGPDVGLFMPSRGGGGRSGGSRSRPHRRHVDTDTVILDGGSGDGCRREEAPR